MVEDRVRSSSFNRRVASHPPVRGIISINILRASRWSSTTSTHGRTTDYRKLSLTNERDSVCCIDSTSQPAHQEIREQYSVLMTFAFGRCRARMRRNELTSPYQGYRLMPSPRGLVDVAGQRRDDERVPLDVDHEFETADRAAINDTGTRSFFRFAVTDLCLTRRTPPHHWERCSLGMERFGNQEGRRNLRHNTAEAKVDAGVIGRRVDPLLSPVTMRL